MIIAAGLYAVLASLVLLRAAGGIRHVVEETGREYEIIAAEPPSARAG